MNTHTPETVKEDLFQMGRTLRHLYVRGCWPAGHQSSMPDYVQDSFAGALDPEGKYHDVEVIRGAPSSKEISHMDEVIQWMHHIPEWQTIEGRKQEISLRKLVWIRIIPGKKGRMGAIANYLGCHRSTVARHIDHACASIANKLNLVRTEKGLHNMRPQI